MWHGLNLVRGLAVLAVGGVAVALVLTHQTNMVGGTVLAVVGAVAVLLKGGDDAKG